MAFEFDVIQSENEFYSAHFLESMFEGDSDVKEIYRRWAEHGAEAPSKKVQALSRDYFRAKGEASRCTNPVDRFDDTRGINRAMIEALGYETRPMQGELVATTSGPAALPVIASVKRDGDQYLHIIEGTFAGEGDDALLDRKVPEQLTDISAAEANAYRGTFEEAISLLFRKDEPPRWILVIAGNEAILAERHKWAQGKWLRFDIDRMFEKSGEAVKQVAILLSREILCPGGQAVLHDGLDDRSHRHAFGVSEDLKDGLREAVEILANEYIYDRRERQKQAVFNLNDSFAQQLKEECLRYIYRLLFVFFAEARASELDIIPMNSEEYRLGYSLEHLRDLELVPLETPDAQNGYFIHDTLTILFKLINEGNRGEGTLENGVMPMPGLKAPLFTESKSTPLLAKAKFRNVAMQRIIELLSLSKTSKRGRGRISYAQLGINQLGAVYEGILGYTGFFAKEDLFEVRDPKKDDGPVFFVPASETEGYRDNEFVMEQDPVNPERQRRRTHAKGSYVFQLAGRDRENSASYYTPEVLTQCVVERSLKELLYPEGREPLTGLEILKLSVLEPAMGSGAFLNEAVNQLSEAYLERRQKELGQEIPTQDYAYERQKVKAFIAANNVYGVDRNPIAAELAKVSLWLNSIYRDAVTPWFGLRLAVGNSLIGCRRAVWTRKQVENSSYREIEPQDLPMGPKWTPLPDGAIYHFLLPDIGMVEITDLVIKGLAPEATEKIKEWRKEFISSKWEKLKLDRLHTLSKLIDKLWQQVVKERTVAADRCFADIHIFGRESNRSQLQPEDQEKVAAELEETFHAGPRLKLLMDAWCALWFWPIEEADKLPSSDLWLMDVETLLRGTTPKVNETEMLALQADGVDTDAERSFVGKHGFIDTEKLKLEVSRYRIAHETAVRHSFHHWELRFAERFSAAGGFDLIVGNPPWVKVRWNEAGLLSEIQPQLALRNYNASEIGKARGRALGLPAQKLAYQREWQSTSASTSIFNSIQQYPLLKGGQTNLYKLFVERAFKLQCNQGVIGMLHPEGLYDDPRGGTLRTSVYKKLRFHAQFRNAMFLFTEVHDNVHFSINIYGPERPPTFLNVSNLFHPRTIRECELHDGFGPVPGIKTDQNKWETRGHLSRLVNISLVHLSTFAALFDPTGTDPNQARLPMVHSEEIMSAFLKLTKVGKRLGDFQDSIGHTRMLDETLDVQKGLIRRESRFPNSLEELIYIGPHLYPGTSLFKNAEIGATTRGDYISIDLENISETYLPRSNYVPNIDLRDFTKKLKVWNGKPISSYPRVAYRSQIATANERTLMSSIIPAGPSHIYTIFTIAFENPELFWKIAWLSSTMPFDFIVKVTGRAAFLKDTAYSLPVPTYSSLLGKVAIERYLKLVCLTSHFRQLYEEGAMLHSLPDKWTFGTPERSDAGRRSLQIELDILSAIALGLSMEEVITMYIVQFPVLQEYERTNKYDQNGRLVPTSILKFAQENGIDCSQPLALNLNPVEADLFGEATLSKKRKPGRTLESKEGEPIIVMVDNSKIGIVRGFEWEDTKMEPRMKRVYVPPFVGYDREADMRAAWEKFAHLAEERS